MARLLIILILILASPSAKAETTTIVIWLAGAFTTSAAIVVSTLQAIAFVAFSLYSSSQARKKKRDAQSSARQEALANLQDRTANILSASAPLQIIYGEPAPVGGSIAAILTSGANDEFKHVVIVFAAHKITSFDKFYIEGVEVLLGAGGEAVGGEFGEYRQETFYDTGFVQTVDVFYATTQAPNLAPGAYASFIDQARTSEADGGFETSYGLMQYVGPDVVNTYKWRALAGSPVGKAVAYPISKLYSWIRISTHLGNDPDTVDAYLAGSCPEWTANHKLSGLAYAVVRLNLNHARFQNPVKITAKIKGKPVYDYRTGLAAYSRNPALCTADFLRSYYGFSANLAQIDVNNFIYAANVCDSTAEYGAAAVAPGGSYARFTCDGSFTTDQDREGVLTQLEDSFGGTAFRSGGVWRTSPGVYATPIKTLNPTDALAPLQIKQASYSSKAVYNTIRGTFIDKDGLGTPVDYPVYVNPTFLGLDGQEKATSKSFVFTGDSRRCRDLARVVIEKSRGGLVVEYPAKFGAWPLQPGDRVWINDPTFGFTNKVMKLTDWVQGGESPLTLQLTEDASAFYDLADEVSVDATPNTDFRNPYLQPLQPTGLTLSTGTSELEILSDGTIISVSKFSWSASTDAYVLSSSGKVQVRATEVSVAPAVSYWIDLPGDSTTYSFKDLTDASLYAYEVRFVNAVGKESSTSFITGVQTGKSAPPPTVAGLALTMTTGGVLASWTANTELDRDYTYLKKGATWAASAELGPNTSAVKRDTTTYPLGWLLAGVTSVVAKHVDTTGNESLLEATANITILSPLSPVFKDVRVEQNKVNFEWFDAKTSQPILRYDYRVAKVVGGVAGGYVSRGSSGSDSRSDNIPFFEAATWRLEITATDVAGNAGPPNTSDVLIALPDDYKPLLNTVLTGAGTLVNAAKSGIFNRVTLLVNTAETWQSHFTSRGWASPQSQINAGFPLYFQPGTPTASDTEDIDVGVIFVAGTIAVQLSTNALAGTPSISVQIGYKKLIGDAYTFGSPGSRNLIASNFRYIRIIVTATSSTTLDLAEIELLQVSVNVLQITESVTVSCLASDVNGTLYTTTRGFTDIQGVLPGAITNGSSVARVEARIVDVGAPGTPAQVFLYLFNAASARVSADQFITINGV